jgi:putative nucleotidyltransferase with HDIG domain
MDKQGKKLSKLKFFLTHKLTIGILFFLATLAIILSGTVPTKYELAVDDISPVDIYATRDIEDKLTTERLQNEAEQKILPQYEFNQDVTKRTQQNIYEFLSNVQNIRGMNELSSEDKIANLREISNIKLSDEQYSLCIGMSADELSQLQITLLTIHTQVMDRGVEKEALEEAINYSRELVQNVDINQKLKDLSNSILTDENIIQPNKVINQQKTNLAKEEARNSVEPIQYKKHEKIIGKGEKVREEHIYMLSELGLLKGNQKLLNYQFGIGFTFIVLLLFFIIAAYLYYFNKKIFNDRSDLILLGLIFELTLLTAILFRQVSIYLVPISAAVMLITILLDTKLAVITNFALSILICLLVKGDISYAGFILLSGIFAAFAVTKTYHRNKLALAGLSVSLINALLIISFGLINSIEIKTMIDQAAYGILNGLLSTILTIGTLPFWEASFNIITPLKLLELSNPNQPLIKRLLLEAPGTYHHSLLVGNLAEAAAESIGGNSLLARVAAYYHDIGKLKRPYFFKENQLDDNPHDRMTANLSTLVITSHTKDGEELARRNKVPLVIRDIIKQHHGTSLVAYFYYKAKNDEKSESVKTDDFRYEGPISPRPKTALPSVTTAIILPLVVYLYTSSTFS